MMTIDTWFGAADAPTLGFLDLPTDGRARGGVVLCPPLGHEHVISYRAMRFLGQEIAARGLAALRFDYVGEGDASGASTDADAVERWISTIETAVRYLRESGIDEVALVGLTSGGLLATEALERLSGIVGLVLWDPALSGRRFLRRQKSMHEMTVGNEGLDGAQVRLLSLTLDAAAARRLEGAEITGARLASAGVDTLLLGRLADAESPATVRLLETLPDNVDYRAVTGQEDLMDVASSIAAIPATTVSTISDWLSGRFGPVPSCVTPTVVTTATVAVSDDGVPIIEKLGRFGDEQIFTIETVLDDSVPATERGLVLMQPAAAEHRIGPGRFQVTAARDLAARGYRAVRFDRRISGETTAVVATEPNMVLAQEWLDDGAAIATGMAQGAPLALVGLCSGAWVSARIAEETQARLTVLLDINYYRTRPYEPGHYASLARQDQHGEPQLGKLRARVREVIPGWLWRLVSPTEIFNDPALLLTAPSAVPGSTVALLLSPEDHEVLVKNYGADAISRLRRGGADIRVTAYDFGDHALFGEGVRAIMMSDVVKLIESSIPPVPSPALRT